MASPPSRGGRSEEKGHAAAASDPPRPERARARPVGSEEGLGGWWWTVVCGVVAAGALLAALFGPLDKPAAAVVIGAAVVSAPGRPRRATALAAVGVLAGITVAALLERPAPLAGVAVAAAAVQLALSPPGRLRLVASGLVIATVAGALALRAADPPGIGGRVDGAAAVLLVLAAVIVALLALPPRGGAAAVPTAAAACAALTVSALGADDVGIGLAAAGLVIALCLALADRPAAALVAAAMACVATPAAGAAPLALAAAAVAAALAVPWSHRAAAEQGGSSQGEVVSRPHPWGLPADGSPGSGAGGKGATAPNSGDDDPADASGSSVAAGDTDDGADEAGDVPGTPPPAWPLALAAVPAGAAALDVAAGRSPSSVLAVAALAVAVGVPILLDRAGGVRPGPLPLGAWPAAGLGALALVLPGRIGWLGDPVPHWTPGVGLAALGAAVAILPLRRPGHATSAPPAAAPPASDRALVDAGADPPGPRGGSAKGPGHVVPQPEPERRRRRRRRKGE